MTGDTRAIEVLVSDWGALRPHHQRGAFFVVDPTLDLQAIGRALTEDRADELRAHLEAERVRRPRVDEVERWREAPEATRFRFVIAQPYVMAQRLSPDPLDHA